MKLYFMRHGHAVQRETMADEERPLTPEGTARIETAAKVIAGLKIAPAHIYSSPRIRARQTAEIVAGALGQEIEIREEVNFDFDLKAVQTLVAASGDADVMFVGHEPTMSIVIGNLTGGAVNMKPGSFARVDLYQPNKLRGELVWLIAPKVFDTLGGG
jgi:phosphohistidine phosphatase